MISRLTLLLPDLLSSPISNCLKANYKQLPALHRLLCAAQMTGTVDNEAKNSFEAHLFNYFDYNLNSKTDLPIAALSRMAEPEEQAELDNDWWMRIDPIHLKVDLNHAYLLDSHSFTLSLDEAKQLTASLNEHFQSEAYSIEVYAAQRWYLRSKQSFSILTQTLGQVVGKDINIALPEGRDAMVWQAFLNEVQMLFHDHPVNIRRESEGHLPINSVWPYGSGCLPVEKSKKKKEQYFSLIIGDDVLIEGLAKHSLSPHKRLSDKESVVSDLLEEKSVLVTDKLLYETSDNYDALKRIEQRWMKPLLFAMQQSVLKELVIDTCNGQQFSIKKVDLLKFWRRFRNVNY